MSKFQVGNPGGPGRPRKAEKYAGQIAATEDRIADLLPTLIANLLTLANGVMVQDVSPFDGSTLVYKEPPDRKANEYLIDRILGRPTQAIEADVASDGSLTIRVEYADPHDPASPPASGATPDPAGGATL